MRRKVFRYRVRTSRCGPPESSVPHAASAIIPTSTAARAKFSLLHLANILTRCTGPCTPDARDFPARVHPLKNIVQTPKATAACSAEDVRKIYLDHKRDRELQAELKVQPEQIASRTLTMPDLKELHQPLATADFAPKKILSSEITRAKPSLKALGIGFSVSYAKKRIRAGKPKKLPYFACRYNVGNLGDVNIVAFHHPLIADWDLMEKDAEAYRMRIRSAIREEMIHSIQVITVKTRYDRSIDLSREFKTAQRYYQHLLGKIIEELATSRECLEVVCTAAQLYYEDWSITSLQKLRKIDKKLHGRHGYIVSELIRQLVQIRFGELTSEEAKGKAWDQKRLFNTARFGTTENLLRFMAGTLRQAMPKLISLSPTLAEALVEIEQTIHKITKFESSRQSFDHADDAVAML